MYYLCVQIMVVRLQALIDALYLCSENGDPAAGFDLPTVFTFR
jgi:hypothetical protein